MKDNDGTHRLKQTILVEFTTLINENGRATVPLGWRFGTKCCPFLLLSIECLACKTKEYGENVY